MKGLYIKDTIHNWRRIIILIACVSLVACSEPSGLYQPINISQTGQTVQLDFEVSEAGYYQFDLLFDIGTGNKSEVGQWRVANEIIPMNIRIIKKGEVYYEKKVNSIGYRGKYTFLHEGKRFNFLERYLIFQELPVGHYSAIITVLKGAPVFNDMPVYAHAYYVSQKEVDRMREKKQTLAKRQKSKWYQYWRLTEWVAEGLFCAVFCSDPTSIFKPIDFSLAGQSVRYDFDFDEVGGCQINMLFAVGNGREETVKRSELFGGVKKDGVIIPLSIRLFKDKGIYYEETVITAGSGVSYYAHYGNRAVSSTVRSVKKLEVPPGSYSVVITTLEDTLEFVGIESFLEFKLFKPDF